MTDHQRDQTKASAASEGTTQTNAPTTPPSNAQLGSTTQGQGQSLATATEVQSVQQTRTASPRPGSPCESLQPRHSPETKVQPPAYADVAAGRQSPPSLDVRVSMEETGATRIDADPPMPRTPYIRATDLHEIPDLPDLDLNAVAELGDGAAEGTQAGQVTSAARADTALSRGKGEAS